VTLFLSGCGNDVVPQEPSQNTTHYIVQEEANYENGGFTAYSRSYDTIDEILEKYINRCSIALAEVEIINLIDYNEYEKFKIGNIPITEIYYNAQINEVLYQDDDFNYKKDIIFCIDTYTKFNDGDKFICILGQNASTADNPNYINVYGALSGENTVFVIKETDNEKYIVRKSAGIPQNEYGIDLSLSEKRQLSEHMDKDYAIKRDNYDSSNSRGNDMENGDDELEYKYTAKYDLFIPNLLNDIINAKSKNPTLNDSLNNEISGDIHDEEILLDIPNDEEIIDTSNDESDTIFNN
jgi:hypothetical protein